MLAEARSRAALRATLGGWLIVALLAVLRDWQAILAMRLADTDDALRLVQVRALLAGQGWFDLHQYRIAPPDGVVMHWSRLVDLPLAGMIAGLRPLLGQPAAEQAAAVFVPLLTLLAAQLGLGRLALRRLGPDFVFLAAVLMVLMLPAMAQFKPLRIDHHGWQIVAVVAALNALLTTDPRRAGWLAGAALAAGLAISLELLPFAALFAAVFAGRWGHDPSPRAGLVHYLDALTLCSGALFLATHGLADLTAYCDALSPAYLAGLAATAFAVRAIACWAASRAPAADGWLASQQGVAAQGLGMLGVAGLLGAGVFLWLAPQCTAGPFARLDPLVKDLWYDNVREGRPVWHQDFAVAAQMLVLPAIALQAAVRLARDEHARFWGEYALLLGGAMAIAVAVSRFSAAAAAIAVVPLAWQLRRWARRVSRTPGWPRRLALALVIGIAVMPGLAIEGIRSGYQWIAPRPSLAVRDEPRGHDAASACAMPVSLAPLGRLPPGTILAPLDLGPYLLLDTPHRVVATGHHRASAAMHDVIAAFLGSPAAAHAIIRRRRVDYVVLCHDLAEAGLYRRRANGGFAAQLLDGRSVDWLSPVALGPGMAAMQVWRVVR